MRSLAFFSDVISFFPSGLELVFMIEAVSVFLQLFWKKVFKRKLFLSAPIHHHFQALGWPETKVTMRFWIIAGVMSIIGVIIYFLG
jgi:phospho-N-acetylmuramoyl-pentapeptide-transferase